jgi:hypothetical protein
MQTDGLKAELDQFDSDSFRADKFLELARRYSDFDELTAPMLHEFVEKVVVHEGKKSNGKREQQVDIHLNFVGQFTAPGETMADSDADEKRAMWRKYKRRQREKKKNSEQAGHRPLRLSRQSRGG